MSPSENLSLLAIGFVVSPTVRNKCWIAKLLSLWYFDTAASTLTLLISSQDFSPLFWFHLTFILDLFIAKYLDVILSTQAGHVQAQHVLSASHRDSWWTLSISSPSCTLMTNTPDVIHSNGNCHFSVSKAVLFRILVISLLFVSFHF